MSISFTVKHFNYLTLLVEETVNRSYIISITL